MQARLALAILSAIVFTPAAAHAWGAISYDQINRSVKYCTGHTAETNAATCTVNDCQGRCEVISTFRDTCAAAVIDERSGLAHISTSPDPDEARVAVIQICGQSGGLDCAVKLSICDG